MPDVPAQVPLGEPHAKARAPRRSRPGRQPLTRRPPARRSVLPGAREAFVPPFKVPEGVPDVKSLTTRYGGCDPSQPQEVGRGRTRPYNARMADDDRGERPATTLGGSAPAAAGGRAPQERAGAAGTPLVRSLG